VLSMYLRIVSGNGEIMYDTTNLNVFTFFVKSRTSKDVLITRRHISTMVGLTELC
jgi:hypothetical protein